MALRFFNTLSRKEEVFKPIGKTVNVYTCGPTVYNYAHIGNLRTYIFEDILIRTLMYNEFVVQRVMNITDVGHLTSDADTGEDKIETGAKREGKSVWAIAAFYTNEFKKDLQLLNILPPDTWCVATDHIQEQIALVQELEKKGIAYIIPEDGVYYDTSKFKNYNVLAKIKTEGLKAGARVELVQGKKNIQDFALWKFSQPTEKRQMEWDSPWGKGFPGWHIECSAMSMKYLGTHFDIHCGGIDHIPVHHTNEIAQTEGVTGKKWVNYWMHGEFLVLEKEAKMGKSLGNFVRMQTLLDKKIEPLAYRYFCLGAHYRSKLSFSWEALEGAQNALHNLKERAKEFWDDHKKSPAPQKKSLYQKQFFDAMNDDLNTPIALTIVWAVVKDKELTGAQKWNVLADFDRVLGLNLASVQEKQEGLTPELQALFDQREQARKTKNWKASDELRNQLLEKGVLVEDTPQGARWKRTKL